MFLDRQFSGTYPSLYRDFSYMMRCRAVAFEGLGTKEGKVERLDFHLASVIGSGGAYVPPRGVYLPHAALRFLMASPTATKKELACISV